MHAVLTYLYKLQVDVPQKLRYLKNLDIPVQTTGRCTSKTKVPQKPVQTTGRCTSKTKEPQKRYDHFKGNKLGYI